MNGFSLPPNLPSVPSAKLPATYEAAKTALAECSRIDECADWANKAEALASYAKQAGDDALRKMADRIQARAIRRCGELLKQVNGRGNNQHRDGSVPMHKVASNAHLSERQRKNAVRVASLPADRFDEQVESDDPPTITKLAEQGKKARPLVDLQGRDPGDYAASTYGQGHLRRFAEFAEQHDPLVIARGSKPHEVAAMRKHIAIIDGWLDRLAVSLEG